MPDLSKMNEAQRCAVTWGEGPLLLLAGPGSGKTYTVTNRILYLIEQGVPPEEILVITFTKEAAEAMQQRFRKMSGGNYPVIFGTFHSVFYHILLESERAKHLKLLTDREKKKILYSIVKQLQTGAGGAIPNADYSEDIPRILAAISLYKNTVDLGRATAEMPSEWRAHFDKIMESYSLEMRKNRGIDFDDMLFACKRLLETDQSFRSSWQRRFRHILIDEFQDCNPVQYEVIKLLSEAPHNIFAVGDDDQSIYGFRGADPDIMRRFADELAARRLLLNLNYRCRREIVTASLAVIGENRNRFPKELQAAENSGDRALALRHFTDRKEQDAWLLREAEQWKSRAAGRLSCAILFRTNSAMQRVAALLHGNGIPFGMRDEGKSIYEHFIVKDIMAYFALASGDWRRELLLRVINRPSRYISREAVGEGRTLAEIRTYYKESDINERVRDNCLDRLERLEQQLRSLGKMSPGLAVSYLLKAVGYEEYLRSISGGNKERLTKWLELTEWFRNDAARYGDFKEWKAAQEAYTETALQRKKAVPEEALQLMTVHSAKGLEFDRVIIPDCNERNFPLGEMQSRETIEEERRIFYVALTRAKKNLELLYLTGDQTRPRLPSRFLNPLLK